MDIPTLIHIIPTMDILHCIVPALLLLACSIQDYQITLQDLICNLRNGFLEEKEKIIFFVCVVQILKISTLIKNSEKNMTGSLLCLAWSCLFLQPFFIWSEL